MAKAGEIFFSFQQVLQSSNYLIKKARILWRAGQRKGKERFLFSGSLHTVCAGSNSVTFQVQSFLRG